MGRISPSVSSSNLKFGELAWAAMPFVGIGARTGGADLVPEITLWLPNLLLPEPGKGAARIA